ncbi:inhibitor of trypsin and hageman factor [Phtheirospermum japonicum]|uniref:Inhibitor of trypsin and hageman factor n=1 Tax=Phtheirospermum japonicum TaxID=374723 RepID=A0A830BSX8_9LAMI|nr:inhibitor of trypsin and hageman factor [Phtheirospermum japonicum]
MASFPGKSSWPELVGVNGQVAAAVIEQQNPDVDAIVLPVGSMVTTDLRSDRVRVYVDRHSGVVVRTPKVG